MTEAPPEICSCSALRQAARHVTRLYDEALAPVGLGLNQYAILAKLDRLGPKVLNDLAALLVMDRSTLGHLLRPLESKGLLTIAVSDADRRRRVIALTRDGVALMKRARRLWSVAERRFEQAFGEDDAHALRSVLKKVETVAFAAPEHTASTQT